MDILDKGYVRLVNVMGSDVDVVNSARVSFDKSVSSLGRTDYSLLDYLISHRHDSVLRHCAMSFEIYAPLFVARQWYKHAVSSTHWDDQNGWNESSRRYVTEEPEFYIPRPFRAASDSKKQGSSGNVSNDISERYEDVLQYFVDTGINMYEQAMKDGIAPEQARLFLPAYGMYIRWRWTASLNALLHFCDLRLDSHAQWEIQQYAEGVYSLVKENFPATVTSWEKLRRNNARG
jgi:thymidylate synthase (FAD)